MDDMLDKFREKLRNHGMPYWTHIGVPWVMTSPISYMVFVVIIPAILLSVIVSAFTVWQAGAILFIPFLVICLFLQYLFLQN